MDEQERSIINGSTELFLKYGIRSITMDDVARELGISKKTLYKYVSNKADLVDRCVKLTFTEVADAMTEVIGKANNAIDELFAIDSTLSEAMKAQHPAIEFQLKKYYPATWKWLSSRQEDMIKNQTLENLKKGIEQGVYRSDVNVDFVSYLYFAQFLAMHDPDIVPLSICENPKFIKAHFEYHLRGVASKKGLEYLEKKLAEHNKSTEQE
ncbi:MAG: TetR/AcrR family transcriptional regulator [Flavobacteriia bacterium]|nr:TetR/AcrR family transcriptional regulator [Flavobacteriia bacterium]